MMGFEPMTSSLPRKRSTPELHRHFGADEETRTLNIQLGRLMLYQLSYIRINKKSGESRIRTCEVEDDGFTVRSIWPLWNLPSAYSVKKELFLEKGLQRYI